MEHRRSRSTSEHIIFSLREKFSAVLPKEYVNIQETKAFAQLFASILFYAGGVFMLAKIPWVFLPIGWVFLGTVFAGLNAIGVDCSVGAFSRYPLVNWLIGNLVLSPVLVPFESFRQQYKLKEAESAYQAVLQTPLWWLSSAYQWARANFSVRSAYVRNRLAVVSSFTIVYTAATVFFSLVSYHLGAWGVVKYWLMPWLVYHFWISTFVAVSYKKRDNGTGGELLVYTRYPKWVEYLTHNLNLVMSQHRVIADTIAVPTYHIRSSYETVKQKLGEAVVKEGVWWREISSTIYESYQQTKTLNVDWLAGSFITITPLISLYGLATTEVHRYTAYTALVWYLVGGLGITAGYHRLFSHRAFEVTQLGRAVFLFMGTLACQGPVLTWCRDHRAHHRFTDTPKDPYGVDKGYLWAHMGWLFFKRDERVIGKTDISDLQREPLIMWQFRNYKWLAPLLTFGVPLLVCGLGWGDWRGGFFYAGMLKTVVTMQATFCINSLAHYFGEATFSDQRSPRDHWLTSVLTFGEGYHNFHHEFPYDYRNGVSWASYDPTKWLIWAMSKLGLAYDLKRFPENEIRKGQLQMAQKKLDRERAELRWGKQLEELPVYTWSELRSRVREGASLVVCDGFVHDVSEFMDRHPGGVNMIKTRLGTDVTAAYNGEVYNHALAARNLLSMMRVGRIQECKED